MGELRQEFLNQTISNLQILQKESLGQETLSDDFLRRFFRHLHTIKGTSNTFSLISLAKLAHQVENLLQVVQNHQIPQNEATKSAFEESFVNLLLVAKHYQKEQETIFPAKFINQLKNLVPESPEVFEVDFLANQIPERLLAKLSTDEKKSLNLAIRQEKNFYLLKVSFKVTDFFEQFKIFKETLNEMGEVLAVSSGLNRNPTQEVNFQIFYVGDLKKNELTKLIENYFAEIEFEYNHQSQIFTDDFGEILELLITNSQKTAVLLGKEINFVTSFPDLPIPIEKLLLISKLASHLLNNAIDHAIEAAQERVELGKNPVAKIEINLSINGNTLLLEVSDDGSGIDIEKINISAKAKGLIDNDKIIDQEEALALIFSSGFSTNHTVTKISGRGIGLDAVKDLVEKEKGRIEIQTKAGKGTIFQIYLPSN